MTVRSATPYLFFNGNAAQALELYESALGAKVEGLQRYGDAPDVVQCAELDKDRVMHAFVRIGEATLMVSDVPPNMTASKGGNVQQPVVEVPRTDNTVPDVAGCVAQPRNTPSIPSVSRLASAAADGVLGTRDSHHGLQVCLDFTDPAEMARMFDALAVGGRVGMALHDTHWGAKFGTLKDAFDIHWMFNCERAAT